MTARSGYALASIVVAVQAAPAQTPSVPQRPGLTIVSAVAGDTMLGNSRGDYELAVTLTALSPIGAELAAESYVRNDVGRYEWLRLQRTVPASDLRASRTQVLGFDTQDVEVVPGTTALGPSVLVMAELRRQGQAEFRVRNYASRRDNPGTLRRVGVEQFPMLLNGRRVSLPAVHVRGQLGIAGHLRPWSFWFLDDPVQPITLKVHYGAEGASETAPPEWLRQVIRIDVPDTEKALGELAIGLAGEGDGGGELEAAEETGSAAGAAAGRGSGSGLGTGAMAGMLRDMTTMCRVVVPGVYFEFDSDQLNPASAPWIAMVARMLDRHREWMVTIEGHTDSIGVARYNQQLSERRAASLRRELVTRYRTAETRLATRGYGATRPLESNTTLEGRARNRRVELVRPCGDADTLATAR